MYWKLYQEHTQSYNNKEMCKNKKMNGIYTDVSGKRYVVVQTVIKLNCVICKLQ